MSTRSDAIAELKSRVETILVANGFSTNAGQRVYLGEAPVASPGDPDASLALVVGEDDPGFQGEHVVVDLPVDIQVIVKADTSDPWTTVEEIIGDVKTAVETDHELATVAKPNGTLIHRGLERGRVAPFDRDSGSEYVGAAIRYNLKMAETWGAP